MNRRTLLKRAAMVPLAQVAPAYITATAAKAANGSATASIRRVRPGEPGWPSETDWATLKRQVGGRLIRVPSPVAACAGASDSAACRHVLMNLRNPFYIGDQPGATQSSGWVDAWMSVPSAYAVAAKDAADVAAAVNFARERSLRLVVKGGGHSYQGTSCAPDSLLIWTRPMNRITLHETFVPQGCSAEMMPQPAVEVGSGAIWLHVYEAVTTQAGRYVQGGGCTTVGVAGLIQSGGFGSFSKRYGTAAASLLEAEIVTADGAVRIANRCANPDLFWAIKGGGGGSFGVVTKLVLKTHELPEAFGAAKLAVEATSDEAFRKLIRHFVDFYRERLFNPHWGEQVRIRHDNTLAIAMVSQGLDLLPAGPISRPLLEWPAALWDTHAARSIWAPFLARIAASPRDYRLAAAPTIASMPARDFWNADFFRKHAPGAIVSDERPGASPNDFWWAGDGSQIGAFWNGFTSTWLPAALLKGDQVQRLANALFAASRHWGVELHLNKGLAGAPAAVVAAAKDTATNPAVLDAFALAIIAGFGPPAYPSIGRAPDLAIARARARAIAQAAAELRKVVPNAGSYVSESDFFEKDWQRAYWGTNYPRLQAVKAKYDPHGRFFVHHGVGSEAWSADGFAKLPAG